MTSIQSIQSQSSLVDMGAHLILDFYNIPSQYDLDSVEQMDAFLSKIIINSEATIESKQQKKFEPQGVSIVYLLSESHFSIHTWPEARACAIDFYHCGNNASIRLRKAERQLCDAFGWNNCISSLLIERGNNLKHLLDCNNDVQLLMKNLQLICHEKSEYQDIKIFDSPSIGKVLTLNNQIQLTESHQDHYSNDMIKKVIDKHKLIENVLVIGGGDFAIPELAFQRYPKLENITIVEVDEKVIEVSNRYFEKAQKIQEQYDEKLELVIEDGADYIRKARTQQKKFDAIIIDSLNLAQPNSFAQSLLTQEFYCNLKKVLKSGASFSQMLVNEANKVLFEQMVRIAGFKEITFVFTQLPESNIIAPIGIAKKTKRSI